MTLEKIESPEQSHGVFHLIQELRPHLNEKKYLDLLSQAKKQGYTLMAYYKDNKSVALLGFRLITDFVHGKHLYIDDLIVSRDFQSKGIGRELLNEAEKIAKKENCQMMRLCTGVENIDGIRFYEKNKWQKRAVAYKKKF